MDFTYEGFTYYVTSDGQYMRDQDAPIPPDDLLERWRWEAKQAFYREVAAEVRKELAKDAEMRQRMSRAEEG